MTCRIVERPPGLKPDEFFAWLKPGDLCKSANMDGHYTFKCPVCDKPWSMLVPQIHQIEQTDPLTIAPSWLCPAGCHYFIRNGEIV